MCGCLGGKSAPCNSGKIFSRLQLANFAMVVHLQIILQKKMDTLYRFSYEELTQFLAFWDSRNPVLEQDARDVYMAFCEKNFNDWKGEMKVKDLGDWDTRVELQAMQTQTDVHPGLRHAAVYALEKHPLREDALLELEAPGKKYEGKTIGEVLQEAGGYSYLHFMANNVKSPVKKAGKMQLREILTKYAPKDFLDLPAPGNKYKEVGYTVRQVLELEKDYENMYWWLDKATDLIPGLRLALHNWFHDPLHADILAAVTAERPDKKRKPEEKKWFQS
jgi:hypothetical protein